MIDYEFRVITQTIRKIAKEKSKAERILLNKINLSHISNKNLLKLNNKYFKNLKKVTGLVYRGLPINKPKDFFASESEVNIEFKKLKNNYNPKLKGLRLIQFPNPNLISLKTFTNFISKEKFYGFEVIPEWHKNTYLSKSYDKFFKHAENIKKPVAVETTFSHKQIDSSIFHIKEIIKKFPNLKLIFPKFGAGIFLFPFLIKNLKNKPILISSTPKSMDWIKILQIKNFNKSFKIVFGTDHPLNGNTSHIIYKKWIKNYDQK